MKTATRLSLFVVLASAAVVGFGKEKPHDNPPEGFKMRPWLESHMPPPLDVRRQQVDALKEGEIRIVPTFINCSVVWGAAKPVDGIALEYRLPGGEWKPGEKFLHFAEVGNYRGSILGLKEDTEYEARIVANGKTLASGAFRTWKSDVPVAKTIVIDPATASYPITIRDQGSPDGWIRYTTKPGAVLGGKDCKCTILRVYGAKYVLIDDIVFEGGGGWNWKLYTDNVADDVAAGKDCPGVPLSILNSRGVRVRNCEFSGWGREGDPVYTAAGKGVACVPGPKPANINFDGAVVIGRRASEVVVERCYMHDARNRSNSWYYSHPSGNEGIIVDHVDYGVVLRWNDIVGSDFHRFNDCIESGGNFHADGAFNRDADVYGNFCIFSNDDSIELDGGMQNVRCFRNRFEAAVSQVSIQGCCASPVYVYENLLAGGGDEFGAAFPCIKTATFDPFWYAPYAKIAGNWHCEPSWKPGLGQTSRWDCRADNVVTTNAVPRKWATECPVRDLPFVLDTGFIKGVEVAGEPVVRTFKAISTKEQPYRVRQNLDADWYEVSPREGTLKAGENEFTVTFKPERMKSRRHWRAAFIVRTPEGLSRCVSIYADNVNYRTPDEPVPPSAKTIYAKNVNPDGGEFVFDITEEGDYHFFAKASPRGDSRFPKVMASVDGAKAKPSIMWLETTHDVWTLVRPGNDGHCGKPALLEPFHLKPGRHTLSLKFQRGRAKANLTGVAVSDRCFEFEAH